MSTLKVDNLLNSAGNESPISVPGAAKAWVHFDGDAANITNSMTAYNVSTLTDHGDGDYSINFTNNMADANYGFTGTAGNITGTTLAIFSVEPRDGAGDERTTSGFRFETVYYYSSQDRVNFNPSFVFVAVFGD
jgi:hypothetical protein